jgi:hypothetical protein
MELRILGYLLDLLTQHFFSGTHRKALSVQTDIPWTEITSKVNERFGRNLESEEIVKH